MFYGGESSCRTGLKHNFWLTMKNTFTVVPRFYASSTLVGARDITHRQSFLSSIISHQLSLRLLTAREINNDFLSLPFPRLLHTYRASYK
jgi:hypothetical protein